MCNAAEAAKQPLKAPPGRTIALLVAVCVLDLALPLTLGVVPGPGCDCAYGLPFFLQHVWSDTSRYLFGESSFDLALFALLRVVIVAFLSCLLRLRSRSAPRRPSPLLEPLQLNATQQADETSAPRSTFPSSRVLTLAARVTASATLVHACAKAFTRMVQSGYGKGAYPQRRPNPQPSDHE